MQRSVPFARLAPHARAMSEDVSRADAMPPRVARDIETAAPDVGRPESLPQLIRGTLGCALGPSVPEAEVREAMRRACAVARAEGLQPEQLLVALKQVWLEMPEARRMLPEARETTLSGLITLCIKEYFAPWRALRAEL